MNNPTPTPMKPPEPTALGTSVPLLNACSRLNLNQDEPDPKA